MALAPKRGLESILGLDRVLWSSAWAVREEALDLREVLSSLRPTTEELHELARLDLRYRLGLPEEDTDRVVFNRATEHVLARRLLGTGGARGRWRLLLQTRAELSAPTVCPRWLTPMVRVRPPASFDERGVHIIYRPVPSPSGGGS